MSTITTSATSNPFAALNAAAAAAGTSSSSSSATSTADAAALGISQIDFLNLMMTQLQNQDPTQPMDTSQMSSQLSQIGTVTGINQLNSSFTSLAGSLTSNQALQASSLLGRDVMVNSSTAALPAGGTVSGGVEVTAGSGAVNLQVFGTNGALVKTIALGTPAAGLASFTWDGTNNAGVAQPAGTYLIQAQGANSKAALQTMVSAQVQSVTLNGGGSNGLTLDVAGVGQVPFSSVTQISP